MNFRQPFESVFPNCREALERPMLWTIVVVLLVLWLLGNVTAYTAGGLIHVLLVIAIIVVIVRVIQGRKPL